MQPQGSILHYAKEKSREGQGRESIGAGLRKEKMRREDKQEKREAGLGAQCIGWRGSGARRREGNQFG